jgi:hypothetical protein
MPDSPKAPVTLLNSVSAPNRERLEQIHSRCLALGAAADKDLGREAAAELTGFIYEIIQMPLARKAIADTNKAPDHSCMIGIHRSTAKAIADVLHTCAGGALDGSDDRLEELDGRTLPALVWIIQWHLEEADHLEEEERQWHEAARGNAKGSAASH